MERERGMTPTTAYGLLCDIEIDMQMRVGDGPEKEWMQHWLDEIRRYHQEQAAELRAAIRRLNESAVKGEAHETPR